MIKRKIKRFFKFIKYGGLQYLSFSEIIDFIQYRFSNWLKSESHKKIFWVGPFSPNHANVGDHAQTLGVKKFLRQYFNDYKILPIYRNDIRKEQLIRISQSLNPDDLILIHSSGDFGSLHDVQTAKKDGMSFPEVRRELLSLVKKNSIINLPVTAYYENNEKGYKSLEKDQKIYNTSQNITILCREEVSLNTVRESLSCKSEFFPDFVFYLKPKPLSLKRNGVLLILRNDKEAILSSEEKKSLVENLQKSFSRVVEKDIMNSRHVIPDFILNNYMEKIFQTYQSYELIITDKMHGMITSVITETPCIALSGRIPHKIKAYQSFLAEAVEFVEDMSEIEDRIKQIKSKQYNYPNLSSFFESFRQNICNL